jgi:hypothetical protein
MPVKEMSFKYSLEKNSTDGYLLYFGRSSQTEGYSLCNIGTLPGSENIADFIVESLNEGPSMMAEINSLQEENAFLQEKVEKLTRELKILKEKC